MARKPTGQPNGRPLIELDETNWKLFEELCKLRCTKKEICAILNISETTLYRRIQDQYKSETFETILQRLGMFKNMSLRSARLKLAMKHEKTNAELCARYLGEYPLLDGKDKQVDENSNESKQLESLIKELQNLQAGKSSLTIDKTINNDA